VSKHNFEDQFFFCSRQYLDPYYIATLLCRKIADTNFSLSRLVLTFYLSVSNNCFIFLIPGDFK
jgi:hypothetical protein